MCTYICVHTYVIQARSDVAVQTDHHDRREHDEIPAKSLEQHLSTYVLVYILELCDNGKSYILITCAKIISINKIFLIMLLT